MHAHGLNTLLLLWTYSLRLEVHGAASSCCAVPALISVLQTFCTCLAKQACRGKQAHPKSIRIDMTSYLDLDLEEIVFSGRRRRAGPEPNADTPIATVPEPQAEDAGQPVVRRAKRARCVKRAPCNLAYEYDANASSDVVLERINGILHGILDALQAGELPCFRESLPAVDAAGAAGQKKPSELSFSPSNEKTTLKLLRALVVLEIVQKLHTEDRTQTQRDIYYEVHSQDLFPTPVSVNTGEPKLLPCFTLLPFT